jgi:hypothetical protein
VLGNFARRLIDLGVLFLALYAFAFVPLGKRTGLEHLIAVLHTRAARNATHEVVEAVERLRERLVGGDAPRTIETRGAPVVPKLPHRSRTRDAILVPAPADDAPDASL